MVKVTTRGIGISLVLAATGGCGAATVDWTARDAAIQADVAVADLGATDRGAMSLDATDVDASLPDVLAGDAAPEARACPVIDDVPAPDVPASDAPYVVELSLSAILQQCARMSDGTVRCRGWNVYGRLGIGTNGEYNVPPTTVPGLRDVEQVMAGQLGATCTRHRDGSVRCWGSNRYNGLGTGHADDQDCMGVPCRMSPVIVPGLTDVVQLVDGIGEICAVRRDGSVWCWGSGGTLLGADSAVPVATRLSDVAALWPRLFGWVWRLRSGGYGSVTSITGLAIPREAEVAEGDRSGHLCYRLPDSSTRCLGYNEAGQVGTGGSSRDEPGVTEPADPGLCGIRSIATNYFSTCAVLSDRTVRCWGDGRSGGLGFTPNEQCASATETFACATRPTPLPGLDGVDRLFVGLTGGCAIRVDRSVWCWGSLVRAEDDRPSPVAW